MTPSIERTCQRAQPAGCTPHGTDSPRSRLERLGSRSLADHELLSLLLADGLQEPEALRISQDLIKLAGSLHGLVRMSGWAIRRLPGVGPSKAARVQAALELGRRLMTPVSIRPAIRCPEDLVNRARLQMLGGGGETVLVAVLDVRLRLIDLVTVGQGSPHTVELDVRRVVESVLVRDGVAMILIHNHPSEDPRPSAAEDGKGEGGHT